MPDQKDDSAPKRKSAPLWPALAAGGAALAALQLLRRQLTGSPIVTAEQGGPYRVLKLRRFRIAGVSPLAIAATFRRPNARQPQWTLGRILMAPSSRRFAVEERELIAGPTYVTDWAISLIDINGTLLFFATDDSYPTTVYSGTDPASPALLLEAQARADAEWTEERQHSPGLPRPILSGRFHDDASAGTLAVAGWLANGDLVVSGRTPMLVTYPDGVPEDSKGSADWWGIVGPVPTGTNWAYSAKGAGRLPTSYPLVAMPPKSLDVTLSDGQILLNGRPQQGFAPMLALDGPYPATPG